MTITTDEDHENALSALSRLMDMDMPESKEGNARMDDLAREIEAYEATKQRPGL